jgi:uncharacterized protein YegL
MNNMISTIHAFVSLCLGSSKQVVWVEDADAAAFSDQDFIYLPKPTGIEGEFELLLALALREVGKVLHSETGALDSSDHAAYAYTKALEDARVKGALQPEMKGANAIFNEATKVISRVVTESSGDTKLSSAELIPLAVWANANAGLLNTPEADSLADFLGDSVDFEDTKALNKVVGIAQTASQLAGSRQASQVGKRIAMLLTPSAPPKLDQHQGADQQGQPQGEDQQGQPQGEDQQGQPQGEDQQGQPQGEDQQGQPQGEDQQGQPQGEDQQCQPQGEDQQGQPQGETLQGPSNGEPTHDAAQGESSDAPASADVMSNALARLKGFKQAREIKGQQPDSAARVNGDEPHAQLLEAVKQALDEQDPIQALKLIAVKESPPGEESSAEQKDCPEEDVYECAEIDAEIGGSHYASESDPAAHQLDAMPARLVSVLLRELQDQKPRTRQLCETGRTVATDRIWRLKHLGETNVFMRKQISSGVDAAVHVLLDRSGSMRRDLQLALNSTNAFVTALQRVNGVQTAMSAFPGIGKPIEDILAFRANPANARKKLKEMTATGGTPTDEALVDVTMRILKVKVKKRVVVVITDGIPDDMEATQTAVKYATENGVSVIGIGIGIGIGSHTSIETAFPLSASINDIGELPTALEKLFKKNFKQLLMAA